MAFQGYLTPEEITDIAQGIVDTVGYGPAERAMFAAVLPRIVAQGLGAGFSGPFINAFNDIAAAQRWERLADGSVPILPFLRLAVRLGGGSPAMDAAARVLARLDSETTGAPRVDLDQVPETKELIVGHDDMVSFSFFSRGVDVAGSVVKLTCPRFTEGAPHLTRGSQTRYNGTGWIIGPGLLITNHHVFNARNRGEPPASDADLILQAQSTEARFDYDQQDVVGLTTMLGELLCWDAERDYAISRIDDHGRAPLSLAAAPVSAVTADSYLPVNIIQHPDGQPKRFGIRNNLVTAATDRDLRYFTDTEGGSSGSPVMDDDWTVVGLHRGATVANGVKYQGRDVAYVNIGTQIHAILDHLRQTHSAVFAELGLASAG